MGVHEKKPLRFYVSMAMTKYGFQRFISSAVVSGAITFFAMSGVFGFMVALGVHQHGVEEVLTELHVTTGVEAMMALQKLFVAQLDALIVAALAIGLIFGLRAAGDIAQSPVSRLR